MSTSNLEYKSYTFQSGAVYEGTFKGTKRHGAGHWHHPAGETYEGQYNENKQQGLGIYIFSNGKRYIGNWSNGEMSGEGLYYFSATGGTYYAGQYDKDKKHGAGYYQYDNGLMTVQLWDHNVLKNEQDATPADAVDCARYVDKLIHAVLAVAPRELAGAGVGAGATAGGGTTTNSPANANPNNGVALKTIASGPAAGKETVVAVEQQLSTPRSFQFPSGCTYTGEYFETKKWGIGYWTHPEGDTYAGHFENNKHSRWGVYITGRTGKKYVGQWRLGKMDGWGAYFFNPEETEYFVGQYQGDKKHGRGLYHFADSGMSMAQSWEQGELKKEVDADAAAQESYTAAIRHLISAVLEVAPQYKSVAYPDVTAGQFPKLLKELPPPAE